ncbi:hypothetical protein EON67_07710, partial [archaeon]
MHPHTLAHVQCMRALHARTVCVYMCEHTGCMCAVNASMPRIPHTRLGAAVGPSKHRQVALRVRYADLFLHGKCTHARCPSSSMVHRCVAFCALQSCGPHSAWLHPLVTRTLPCAHVRTRAQVMEMMTGGELFDRILEKSKYTEAEAAIVVRDIADALYYCHSHKIAHRDLKVRALRCIQAGVPNTRTFGWLPCPCARLPACLQPENLLYADRSESARIKIADFGFACRRVDDAPMDLPCGTPGYVGMFCSPRYHAPPRTMWPHAAT